MTFAENHSSMNLETLGAFGEKKERTEEISENAKDDLNGLSTGIFDKLFGKDKILTKEYESEMDHESLESFDIPKPRIEDFTLSDRIPGFKGQEILVCGKPLDAINTLDYRQGDANLFYQGDCGLVSCANFLTQCGGEGFTEEYAINFAKENDLCVHGFGVGLFESGGTTEYHQCAFIESHGIDAMIRSDVPEIIERFEGGCAVVLNVNSGILWNDPAYYGDGGRDHAVTMTGTLRDPDTGALLGITVCDSGSNHPCTVIPIDKIEACVCGPAIISKDPVRL